MAVSGGKRDCAGNFGWPRDECGKRQTLTGGLSCGGEFLLF